MSYYSTLLSTPEGGIAAIEEKELKIGIKKVCVSSSVFMIYTKLYIFVKCALCVVYSLIYVDV